MSRQDQKNKFVMNKNNRNISLLSDKEMCEVKGGMPWYLVPFGWIAVEMIMNPKTVAEYWGGCAADELEKIRNGY